jgi:hypothetical protein
LAQPGVFGAAEPANGIEVEPRADAARVCAGAFGQCRAQFQLGRREHVGEAKLRRGSRQAGERQRLGLGGRQARELGAVAVEQLEATARAAIRIDRHVRGAELIDVAIDGANRNLEFARQRFGRHPAAGLQQQQDRQQPARTHFRSLAEIPDTRCQVWRPITGTAIAGAVTGRENMK